MAVSELKELLRCKLMFISQCIESGRIHNLSNDMDNVFSMACQLSNLTDIDDTLNNLELVAEMLPDLAVTGQYVPNCPRPELTRGHLGRPSFLIDRDVLEFLLSNCFKVQDIASMLGVGKRTIERRLQEYGLGVSQTYSEISDDDLVERVQNIVKDFPHVGYRSVSSILKSEGYRIQEYRVRNAMKMTDPEGILFRRLFLTTHRIQRRTYSVAGSQALWHIDGNHKLIR